MSYSGYSLSEYVSEVVGILHHRFGMSDAQATRAVYDSQDYRYYSYGRSSSPSALANKIGKAVRVRAVPRKGPPMESGYAYVYEGRGQWDTVVVGAREIAAAKFKGFGTVDGSRMAMWTVGRKTYAQTAVGPRHEANWRSDPRRRARGHHVEVQRRTHSAVEPYKRVTVRKGYDPSRRVVEQGYDVERIHINVQVYDRHGRYYGSGAPLYRVTSRDTGRSIEVRAQSAKEAREKVYRAGAKPQWKRYLMHSWTHDKYGTWRDPSRKSRARRRR